MNFHNERDYSYAILGNEDGLVFAKHKEHHRTNNQERYIYANYLNNIAIQFGTETRFPPIFGESSFYHLPGRYQHDKTEASQREHCCTECFGYSKVVLSSNTICIISTLSRRSMVMRKQSLFLYDFRVNHRDRLCLATVVAEVV